MINSLCPFCTAQMKRERRSVSRSIPADDRAASLPKRIARDEFYRCPACFFCATFSYPITEEEYEATLQAWGGHRIEDYHIAEGQDQEEVRARLLALGYIE